MSFLNPLGLLGLIAVPILIIIYIIKNKYTEQVIASTYMWTLSERFLKRKKQIKSLTGIISLILQILAVTAISLAIAHPVFTLPGQAKDYLFILDGSGSMHITQRGETRFELGKKQIENVIRDSAKGSSYSLICVGESANKVFENVTDERRALSLLENAEVSYVSNSMTQALGLAQQAFAENDALQVYLVTDKSYERVENVTLVNVSGGEENYAVSDVSYVKAGDTLTVSGKLYSYEGDASLDVSLYLDGAASAIDTKTDVSVEKFTGENATSFSFTCDRADYDELKVVVENSDALALDNQTIVYNDKSDDMYTTLIVSNESTFFLQRALSSLGNLKIYAWNTQTYTAWLEDPASVLDPVHGTPPADFGLYIYNGYTPEALPRNAAVWFIDPTDTLEHTGFSVSEKVDFGNPAKNEVERNDTLNVGDVKYSASTATSVTELLENAVKDDDEMKVAYYARCDLVRDFRELLYCNNDPVLFAGANDFGNRQVVFAFDFLYSNLPTTFDFSVLVYNLIEYTFPKIVEETSYFSGDTVRVNVLSNVNSIRVETPSGGIIYLDTSSDAGEFEITEVGAHTVIFTSGVNQSRIKLYCELPASERLPFGEEESFALTGELQPSERDGIYDELLTIFIILAALFVADWMVYCYEQYQLR